MSQTFSQCNPLRIVVLSGGNSAEREVSLESGACVAVALRQRGHRVLQFDPSILALHEIPRTTDVIFPMLHGTGGEDGTLQRQLDRLGIPWLGSSAEASALTFDKVATREILAKSRTSGCPWNIVFTRCAQQFDSRSFNSNRLSPGRKTRRPGFKRRNYNRRF